jgi:hypothetical protein
MLLPRVNNLNSSCLCLLILPGYTEAVARLDAGIVGSNTNLGMDLYMYEYVYSMFVLPCVGKGLAMS